MPVCEFSDDMSRQPVCSWEYSPTATVKDQENPDGASSLVTLSTALLKLAETDCLTTTAAIPNRNEYVPRASPSATQLYDLLTIYRESGWTSYGHSDSLCRLVEEARCCVDVGLRIPDKIFTQLFMGVCSSAVPQKMLPVAIHALILQVHLFPRVFADLAWLTEDLCEVLENHTSATALALTEVILSQHARCHAKKRFWLCPVSERRNMQLVVKKVMLSAAHQPNMLRFWCNLLVLAVHTDNGPPLSQRVSILVDEVRNHFHTLLLEQKALLLASLSQCVAFRLARRLLEERICMGGRSFDRLEACNGKTVVDDALALYIARLLDFPMCSPAEADEYVLYVSTFVRLLWLIGWRCCLNVECLHQLLQQLVGGQALMPSTLRRLRLLQLLAV